ncbi:MAG: TlpA family protein disulfide reductase [Gammaproteobacteria bacterium]|nr:TlpA family protein disulfide reductase [Gammaproteobacteria bacterium]
MILPAHLLIAALLVLGVQGHAAAAHGVPGMERLDGVAPAFVLETDSPAPLSLETLRGRAVLLHFFATWCLPCRDELPKLAGLQARLPADRIAVIAIAIDEDAGAIAAFAAQYGRGLPVHVARAGEVPPAYWTWGVPVTYLLDAAGRFVARALGPRDWSGVTTDMLIEAAAASGAR